MKRKANIPANMKCPNCKKFIHPPNENEDFVICPYCIQSTAPVPQPVEAAYPPLVKKLSSVQLIAIFMATILFGITTYIYITI